MRYRLIPHNNSKILRNVVYDVYELINEDSVDISYTTGINGILGISFILKGHSHLKQAAFWGKNPDSSIYGMIKKPDVIKISSSFREIAIGFKPFFFHLLVSNSMNEIISHPTLDAKEIFDSSSIEKLHDKLRICSNDLSIIKAIEAFILRHISNVNYDKRLLNTMQLIYSAEKKQVGSLCDAVNLSSTGLRNLCLSGLGRSPKEIIQIIRMNKILSSSEPNMHPSLQDMTFKNGYFDQAHFIHDFNKIMGMAPKKYFENQNLTFDFYNFKRWKGDIFGEKLY
jgi:AraC-like DNA-binding protein